MIGIDTDIGRDTQRFFNDGAGVHLRLGHKRPGRRFGIGSAGTDSHNALFGFNDVSGAGQDERRRCVGYCQQGLESTQHTIGAPILGELHSRSREVALMLLQFGLEPLEQGKRIGGSAGKARDHLIVIKPPDFAGVAFHAGIAQCHLTVSTNDDAIIPTYGENRRSMHGCFTHVFIRGRSRYIGTDGGPFKIGRLITQPASAWVCRGLAAVNRVRRPRRPRRR